MDLEAVVRSWVASRSGSQSSTLGEYLRAKTLQSAPEMTLGPKIVELDPTDIVPDLVELANVLSSDLSAAQRERLLRSYIEKNIENPEVLQVVYRELRCNEIDDLSVLSYMRYALSVRPIDLDPIDSWLPKSSLDLIVAFLRSKLSSKHHKTTPAGRVAQPSDLAPTFDASGWDQDTPRVSAREAYLFELLVDAIPSDRDSLDGYWALLVPASLNMLDDTNIDVKIITLSAISLMATKFKAKLQSTGIEQVYFDSVKPILQMVPPSVDVDKAMALYRPAVRALLLLADSDEKRLNYVMRAGPLSALKYTDNHVAYTIFILGELRATVEACKSLTVVHLAPIVEMFQAVMCDPFVDMSRPLVDACCEMMAEVLRYSWPRIDFYKYNVLLALTKAGALDTECSQLLQEACPMPKEVQQLTQSNQIR